MSDWEAHVAAGGDEIDTMLRAKRPLIAQAMLRPFFEAYEIVADVLRDAPAEIDEKELTKKALGVGRQYVAQNRVRSNESVSALLFATARQVVADQHLLEPAADLVERRTAFRDELRGVLRRHGQGRADRPQAVLRARDAATRAAQQACLGRPAAPRFATPYAGHMTTAAPSVRTSAVWPVLFGVARAGRRDRRGPRRAVAGRRADRHRTARSGPGHHLRPAVRAGGGRDRGACVAVGSFLFAAFLVPPQTNGVLDAAGYRALRARHGRIGGMDGVRGAAGAADRLRRLGAAAARKAQSGQTSGRWPAWSTPPAPGAGRAFLAAVVTRGQHPGAALVVDAGVVRRLVGHADAAGADGALVVGRRTRSGHQQPAHPPDRRRAVGGWPAGLAGSRDALGASTPTSRRGGSRRVALWCFVAMALSGVINALVRIRLPAISFDFGYGWLVIAKFVALCALGFIGWRQRRSGRGGAASRSGGSRPAGPAGAGRGGRLRADFRHRGRAGPYAATAAADRRAVSPVEVAIGYDFAGPPTVARVLFDWRFDLIFGTAAIVMAVLYLPGCAGCAVAGTHGRSAASLAWMCRLRGAAVHDVIGTGSLYACDVQHAHGGAHAAVDAGADSAGAWARP